MTRGSGPSLSVSKSYCIHPTGEQTGPGGVSIPRSFYTGHLDTPLRIRGGIQAGNNLGLIRFAAGFYYAGVVPILLESGKLTKIVAFSERPSADHPSMQCRLSLSPNDDDELLSRGTMWYYRDGGNSDGWNLLTAPQLRMDGASRDSQSHVYTHRIGGATHSTQREIKHVQKTTAQCLLDEECRRPGYDMYSADREFAVEHAPVILDNDGRLHYNGGVWVTDPTELVPKARAWLRKQSEHSRENAAQGGTVHRFRAGHHRT